MIIDAHLHLWEKQQGMINGKPVFALSGGRSNFCGEIVQMMPPYMVDGRNTADMLFANMDYTGVSGCVVTQEYMDGNQDRYLLTCKEVYKERIKICCLYEEKEIANEWVQKFDGIKICAGRLENRNLLKHTDVFEQANRLGKFVSIDMAEGEEQTEALQAIVDLFPNLRIAIGHFGMVTVKGWEKQIELARNPYVYIESGGITWLYHKEYYPYPSAIKAIKTAADICGMKKLMWGSDYPRTMTAITYLMSLDFIQKTDQLSEKEKAMILGENAKEFYSFSTLEEPKHILNMVE